MSWAADGQDGNGLQLKKSWANFFKFFVLFLGKLAKIQIVNSLFEVHFNSSYHCSFSMT